MSFVLFLMGLGAFQLAVHKALMYLIMTTRKEGRRRYLHHEKNGVEDDEGHDEVLEGGGDDHPPQLVLEAVSLFWHVTLQWLRL